MAKDQQFQTLCVSQGNEDEPDVAPSMYSETLLGVDYVVFPAVCVVAGVLNGMLLPASEIDRSVDGWNGRPVTLAHPKRDGVPTTANTPYAWTTARIGWLFNARYDDGRLLADAWIEASHGVVAYLRNGGVMEVSTGYFCTVEEREGEYNGELYSAIQSSLIPDHLALLVDQEGACSWQDGCGVPRVNASEDSQTGGNQTMQDEKIVNNEAGQVDADTSGNTTSAADTAPAVDGELLALKQLLEDFGGAAGLRATLARVHGMSQNARNEQVARIVAMSANSLTAADLDGLKDETLAKMEQALRPANYAARAGATNVAANSDDEWIMLSPVPGKEAK